MNDIVIESLIEKTTAIEKRIGSLENSTRDIKPQPDVDKKLESIEGLRCVADQLRMQIAEFNAREPKIDVLGRLLSETMTAVKNPPKQKVVHELRAHKLIWALAAMIIMCCLLGLGWYRSSVEATTHHAASANWRYLKLVMDTSTVKRLHQIELYYLQNKNKVDSWMDSVELRRRQQREAIEMAVESERRAKVYREAASDSAVEVLRPAK